jgi:hypothetical protein
MSAFPKMFSSTKNIPDTNAKHHKQHRQNQQNQQHPVEEKPFSNSYCPQDEFDFTKLLTHQQKYLFSLDPAVIFPQEGPFPFNDEQLQKQYEEKHFVREEVCPLQPAEPPIIELPEPDFPDWEELEVGENSVEDSSDDSYFGLQES